MSVGGRIWIGQSGSEVLFETGFTLSETEEEHRREGRVASGKLAIDVIATKKHFTVSYPVITQAELDLLLTEYNRQEILVLKVERDDLSVDEYNVKFRPISRTRLRAMGTWLHRGVSFTLDEE